MHECKEVEGNQRYSATSLPASHGCRGIPLGAARHQWHRGIGRGGLVSAERLALRWEEITPTDSTKMETKSKRKDAAGHATSSHREQRLVHLFREEDFPHGSDGIQINALGWRCRIGWFAAKWKYLPTKIHVRLRGRTKQIRIGKLAIACAPKSRVNAIGEARADNAAPHPPKTL